MTVGAGTGADAGGGELGELLRRVALRDQAAFAALYNRTSAKLFGIVSRILPARDAAADVVQEAYVRIWDRAGDFDPAKGSPLGWMATIARNRALDEVRRARPVSLEDMPAGFEPAADPVDPLGSRERSETLTTLMACLGKLDGERRAALMLAYYHGASREALARRFQKPVGTIKTWLHRSLAQLRDCLAS
jgi:RNA polymerase sigma-70 factor, ECF subfamily